MTRTAIMRQDWRVVAIGVASMLLGVASFSFVAYGHPGAYAKWLLILTGNALCLLSCSVVSIGFQKRRSKTSAVLVGVALYALVGLGWAIYDGILSPPLMGLPYSNAESLPFARQLWALLAWPYSLLGEVGLLQALIAQFVQL